MSTLKFRGILARPGYNEKYKKEVSWDELKRTFTLYKRIPMIAAAGSHSGPIDPSLAIGHVDAIIDNSDNIIYGDYIFHKERFGELPAKVQEKLSHNGHIHASLGYTPYGDIRKIDHILIGAERPVFEDIGFHAEEDDGFRYEETEGIGEDKKEEPQAPEPTEAKPVQKVIQMTEEQFDKLIATLSPKEKEPVTEAPVVEEKEEVQEEPEEEAPDTPLVEPEKTFPKTKPNVQQHDDMFTVEGGKVISTPLGGHTKEE